MADWATIEAALSGWVESITGLRAFWRGRPFSAPWTDGFAVLSISGRRHLGNDEIVYEYDSTADPGEEIIVTQEGQRQFTLSIMFRLQTQATGNDAKVYSQMIRDSVALPTRSRLVFEAAGIDFAYVISETDIEALIDGREMSITQIDLRFNYAAQTADTPTGYIATLEDFELQSPAGVTLFTGDIEVG